MITQKKSRGPSSRRRVRVHRLEHLARGQRLLLEDQHAGPAGIHEQRAAPVAEREEARARAVEPFARFGRPAGEEQAMEAFGQLGPGERALVVFGGAASTSRTRSMRTRQDRRSGRPRARPPDAPASVSAGAVAAWANIGMASDGFRVVLFVGSRASARLARGNGGEPAMLQCDPYVTHASPTNVIVHVCDQPPWNDGSGRPLSRKGRAGGAL